VRTDAVEAGAQRAAALPVDCSIGCLAAEIRGLVLGDRDVGRNGGGS